MNEQSNEDEVILCFRKMLEIEKALKAAGLAGTNAAESIKEAAIACGAVANSMADVEKEFGASASPFAIESVKLCKVERVKWQTLADAYSASVAGATGVFQA